ncbi:PecA family PE domain-processing aspartic protease [Mycobacterium sp. NAZ190054]|uniref:PecA family PE domain-processing aspartic protease n=1 Tax=Mycobacterium sp. NAZ190054 TaxID=1747766 RepID=UPI00079B8A53|nr:PecA family PE domain-processing aspartic protease [Mycobacterium sp. NAZ190054]KWX60311.1 hypothetical protein ASJ79_01375 [Mycobacterium sp. NAZ190054]
MNFSSWAATVVASPAIAAGILLAVPAVAQAAPDDTGSSSSENTAATGSEDTSPRPTQETDDDDRAVRSNDDDSDDEGADKDADVDTEVEVEVEDDGETSPGPHYVPSSVREPDSESLVSVTAIDDDEDEDDEDDDDDPQDPEDDEDPDGDDTDTVELAIDQLAQAREELRAATWGDGNVFAGLAAIVPQMLMGGAQANLERWMENHARLQEEFVNTLDNPFANAIIRMRLENSMYRPIRAQDQMELAEKLMPIIGWFGPRDAVLDINTLVHDARDNGLVYEVLDLTMQYNGRQVRTEPVIYISVNGGERVPVLLDSGSNGLVIDPRYVGYEGIGEPVGPQGSASYGDGNVSSYYHPYSTTIRVGEDIDSDETEVLIIDLESVYDFTEYNGDYVGVLGIGPKAGPGTVNVLAALPGLLGRGLLIDERRRRVILGPNPYAARVTLDGTPNTDVKVQVGDNDMVDVDGWIDSGGILGNIPSRAVGGATSVPVGTLISVYTDDGETLLYSYRTTRANTPDVGEDGAEVEFNTGYLPFSLTSIYFDYGGDGKTVFNYR